MIKLDSIDRKLIVLLGQDASLSAEELAKRLSLSAVTIRRRLKKLLENNLVRIVGVVNASSIGYPILAIIALDVASENISDAIDLLSKKQNVRFISTTTGRYDIIVMVRFQSNDNISDFLLNDMAKIKGLRNSETFVCLQTRDFIRPFSTI